MTVRVAMIGTSHVGALALAWRQLAPSYPEVSVEFFAAPGWNFRRLQINDAKSFGILDSSLFEPHEIRLLKSTFQKLSLELSDFDVVLYVGRDVHEQELAGLLANFSIDDIYEIPGRRPLSQAAFKSFAKGLVDQSVLPAAWRLWEKPVLFVLSAPRVSESCVTATVPLYRDWIRLSKQADKTPFAPLFENHLENLRRAYKAVGITFVIPDERVLGPLGLTLSKYRDGARQLNNTDYSSSDHKHMNADYGRVVLEKVLTAMEAHFGQTLKVEKPIALGPAAKPQPRPTGDLPKVAPGVAVKPAQTPPSDPVVQEPAETPIPSADPIIEADTDPEAQSLPAALPNTSFAETGKTDPAGQGAAPSPAPVAAALPAALPEPLPTEPEAKPAAMPRRARRVAQPAPRKRRKKV